MSAAKTVAGRRISNVTPECEDKRCYWRLVYILELANGEDACLQPMKDEMAWHYKHEDEQNSTMLPNIA